MRLENPLVQGAYEFQPYHNPISRMGLEPLFYGSSWYSGGSRTSEKNNNIFIIYLIHRTEEVPPS